jgi:hypothetical protein
MLHAKLQRSTFICFHLGGGKGEISAADWETFYNMSDISTEGFNC